MPQLLAIGDVHLGTRPSSIPEEAAEWGVDPLRLTPAAALESVVDLAIAESVAAVIFAGDVVESTNARYEAIRSLESAVRKLVDAGIEVLAVVGNHDVEALPRIARLIDGFKILGEGGQWEAHVVKTGGQAVCEVIGWSFPQCRVTSSPVAELLRSPLPPASPVIPRLGLVHCDLDAASGPYAPVARGELQQAGLDAWLLGHIHKPSLGESSQVSRSIRAGYLGSLVGLNPKETGDHGPWMIRIEAGKMSIEHLPLAPLRWERADLRVGLDDEPDDLGDRLLEALEQRTRKILSRGITPDVIGFRLRLTGESRKYDEVRSWVDKQQWGEMVRTVDGSIAFVEQVVNSIGLAVDLEEIAKGDDPPGLLARKLVTLDRESDERADLLEEARAKLREVAGESHYSPLSDERDADDLLSDDAIIEQLEHAGISALNALLAQRHAARPGEAGRP